MTEQFHRRDVGHIDVQITLDDPETFTQPVTVRVPMRLQPTGDLLEYFCSENERDFTHVSGHK
jgi:hypothetical protein